MQRKFVNLSQFAQPAAGFGQPLVNQPRFNGQPLQSSNHRVAALLPDPITPPIRIQNFTNRNKKSYNPNANVPQPQPFNLPRNKITAPNADNRIHHKVILYNYSKTFKHMKCFSTISFESPYKSVDRKSPTKLISKQRSAPLPFSQICHRIWFFQSPITHHRVMKRL